MFQNNSKMKNVLIIICLSVFSSSIAQENALKPFNVNNTSIKNPVYHYLVENYHTISEKKESASNGVSNCGYTQMFSSGITYEKRNCGDASLATGEVLTIKNPDADSVIIWVEALNDIYTKGEDNNVWNFEHTQYMPLSYTPGAYFEIYRDIDSTTILVMSGC